MKLNSRKADLDISEAISEWLRLTSSYPQSLSPTTKQISSSFQSMLNKICTVAFEAGQTVMRYYKSVSIKSGIKPDGTIVTEADFASEKVIISLLKSSSSDIPIVSEESSIQAQIDNDISTGTFWLVDPLDGTEVFMRKRDQFAVNIGLVKDHKPVLGVVYFPVRDIMYSGVSGIHSKLQMNVTRTGNYESTQIKTRSYRKGGEIVALLDSRPSHSLELDILLRKVKISKTIVDYDSPKLFGVATGEIDLSTISRSFEWDTSAAHAILKGAGGNIIDASGRELQYGKPGFKNPILVAHGGITELAS
jgi:3'(2'), 5'-bisphosphate nucleotidase